MKKKFGGKRFAAVAITVCIISQGAVIPSWAGEAGYAAENTGGGGIRKRIILLTGQRRRRPLMHRSMSRLSMAA